MIRIIKRQFPRLASGGTLPMPQKDKFADDCGPAAGRVAAAEQNVRGEGGTPNATSLPKYHSDCNRTNVIPLPLIGLIGSIFLLFNYSQSISDASLYQLQAFILQKVYEIAI